MCHIVIIINVNHCHSVLYEWLLNSHQPLQGARENQVCTSHFSLLTTQQPKVQNKRCTNLSLLPKEQKDKSSILAIYSFYCQVD
jgi:hypothetical protein